MALNLVLKPNIAVRVGAVRITYQGKHPDGRIQLGFEGPPEQIDRLKAQFGVDSAEVPRQPQKPTPAPAVEPGRATSASTPSRPVLSLKRK